MLGWITASDTSRCTFWVRVSLHALPPGDAAPHAMVAHGPLRPTLANPPTARPRGRKHALAAMTPPLAGFTHPADVVERRPVLGCPLALRMRPPGVVAGYRNLQHAGQRRHWPDCAMVAYMERRLTGRYQAARCGERIRRPTS